MSNANSVVEKKNIKRYLFVFIIIVCYYASLFSQPRPKPRKQHWNFPLGIS